MSLQWIRHLNGEDGRGLLPGGTIQAKRGRKEVGRAALTVRVALTLVRRRNITLCILELGRCRQKGTCRRNSLVPRMGALATSPNRGVLKLLVLIELEKRWNR